jgi:hypothetical protein
MSEFEKGRVEKVGEGDFGENGLREWREERIGGQFLKE